MKQMNNKKIGNLGEEISLNYLKNKGFKLINRNWAKLPLGEIDIIAEKNKIIYFVEVKTTATDSEEFPLEHLDSRKLKKFQRIVNHYLIENNLIDSDYKLSAIICILDTETKKAKINFIEDFY